MRKQNMKNHNVCLFEDSVVIVVFIRILIVNTVIIQIITVDNQKINIRDSIEREKNK